MKFYKPLWLIYIVAGLAIAALVIFGLLYMQKSRDQVQYIDAVEHTYKVISSLNFCEKTLFEAEAAQRGFLLTGDSDFVRVLRADVPLIDSTMKVIGDFVVQNDSQKTFFYQLTKHVTARVEILKINLNMERTDSLSLEDLRNGTLAMDNCKFYMKKMRGVEERLLAENLADKNKHQKINYSYFTVTFITSCLICVIAIGIFFRELSIRLSAQQSLRGKVLELSNSKKELEEITFAASHDLQEPMRKIRILSNLAAKKLTGKVPDEDIDVINRTNKITEQMHGLLTDLVLYTNLLNPNETYGPVNFYDVVKDAYDKVLKDADIQFQIAPNLPVVQGSSRQLETMLINIFDNALKFKSPDRDLSINITYELKPIRESKYFWGNLRSNKYHQVTISDNGIGLDNQYSDKIFGLFQRLHTHSEYPGKGLGLSMARTVMTNHKGYISATGIKEGGASFVLYFPMVV